MTETTDATDGQNWRQKMKRIEIRVFEIQPNGFSKLIPAACDFKNSAQETYLFVTHLWFFHFTCDFFALSFIAIEGE